MNVKIIGIGAGGSHLAHFLGQFFNFHHPDTIVTLIDGDIFESRNRQNQRFSRIGNKAEVKKDELRLEWGRVRFRSVPEYVDNENKGELIEDGDIVFLAVDNHTTRSIVNGYVKAI